MLSAECNALSKGARIEHVILIRQTINPSSERLKTDTNDFVYRLWIAHHSASVQKNFLLSLIFVLLAVGSRVGFASKTVMSQWLSYKKGSLFSYLCRSWDCQGDAATPLLSASHVLSPLARGLSVVVCFWHWYSITVGGLGGGARRGGEMREGAICKSGSGWLRTAFSFMRAASGSGVVWRYLMLI